MHYSLITNKVGLHRISGRPDIRPFFYIRYPAGYPAEKLKGVTKKTTGCHFLNNFYSFRNFTVIFSGDLGFEERIYHVKFFWPDIRLSGKRNRISGRIPDIKKRTDIRPAGYPVQPYFISY